MGYFGSMYGSSYGANAPSASSMMFMPNAYGGYSTVAGGSPAGAAASQQLSSLRNLLGGAGGAQAAFRALAPYQMMAVSPMDMGAQMQRTFGQAGINLGQATSMAKGYMDQLMQNMQGKKGESKPQGENGGGGPPPGAAYGGSQQRNPLDFLGSVFGQYGGGGGGSSFGSGWGYR
jgi:hypothetical protein